MPDEPVTGGGLIAEALEAVGVEIAFGIVSVHNLPILDAMNARGRIRFVPTRNEAGATSMADGYARATGRLAAVISSTGPGAANTIGSLLEAQVAGSPVLHVTGEIPSHLIGRGGGSVHDSRDQHGVLASVSKAIFRVGSPQRIPSLVAEAAETALAPPMGPVTIEVPIDIQKRKVPRPGDADTFKPGSPALPPQSEAIDRLARCLEDKRRVIIWSGSGAAGAGNAIRRLLNLGMGHVSSIHGRGVIPEDDPRSLGAFNIEKPILDFYESCDAMIVVGSRLRGHETRDFTVALPEDRHIVDVDLDADGRTYSRTTFTRGDAAMVLDGLADRLVDRFRPDPLFHADLVATRAVAVNRYMSLLGPYGEFCAALRAATPKEAVWVRDITISNTAWGNRLFPVFTPRDNIYPVAAGIGLGLPLAIGAALGAGRPVLCMSGDGGLCVNLAEMLTAVDQNAAFVLLVMNDRGYGIIRNIQDSQFGGRRFYADVRPPDIGAFCRSIGADHRRIASLDDVGPVVGDAFADLRGLKVVELDMAAFGEFSKAFPAPPVDHNANAGQRHGQ
ncbi:MAG: thiamine pyrophosphate-binding protein [Bauldia sp.]|nr:thiamine pyrophosphate-binding protein [Bauldia sp.]